jgi:hypothetical protein
MHIEYQHKANLCKTFDGLKREASEKADDDLGKELLQAMVKSNAHNPAKNLDIIKSKTPLTKTYETAADKILDTLKDIKEILRK